MLLIQNAHIKTMAGADIPNGCLLIEDGKIAAVAPEIDAPVDAKVIDAQGRLLTPGCVEAHCHIGLDNQAMRWEGMDYNEIVDPLTPQLRAIDSINPQDEAFGLALRGGVGQLLTRLPPHVEARCILGCVRGKFVAAAIPVAYKERLGRVHIGLILAVMPAVEDKFDSSGEGQRSADGAKRQIF